MKDLKHLILFEAFESSKLSKTLGYIKDKKVFLSNIKTICNYIDFPYSELKDDFFEYLPFNKALRKADAVDDTPCKATSLGQFRGHGIEGEKCEKGRMNRKWGANKRNVVCPACNGTGVQIKKQGDIKLVKFWFSQEGKYIGTTGVDGLKRGANKMSHDINDYTIGETINKSKVRTLPTGTFLLLNYSGYYSSGNSQNIICYLIKERSTTYAIQNRIRGASPWSYPNWSKIAPNSFEVYSNEISNVRMLIPNDTSDNPFDLNVGITFDYSSISVNQRIDVKDLLKDAHFSLIFDFGKLKESEYKKKMTTREERRERKEGSKLEMTDEKVRKQNIERYIDKISRSINLNDDVSNVSKLVKRVIGFRQVLYMLIASNYIKDDLSSAIECYYRVLSNKDDQDYVDRLNYYVERGIERGSKNLQKLSTNLKELKDELKNKPKELELIKRLDEISLLMYKRISELELETIEDLEIAHQKLLAYKNILTSSRYKIRHINSFINYLVNSSVPRSINYLVDYTWVQDNMDDILEETDRIKKIINKL